MPSMKGGKKNDEAKNFGDKMLQKKHAKEYAEKIIKYLGVPKAPAQNVCVVCNKKLEAHEIGGNCCDTCWLNS